VHDGDVIDSTKETYLSQLYCNIARQCTWWPDARMQWAHFEVTRVLHSRFQAIMSNFKPRKET